MTIPRFALLVFWPALRRLVPSLVTATALTAALLPTICSSAQAFDTKATYAVLMDAETGAVLYEKNGDVLTAPASMSKLMTMAMLFEALQENRVTLDDTFLISENAWRKGGAASGSSTMFAQLDSRVSIRDLIRGVIVQSGNDACIAIAEGLKGSEAEFAAAMTRRARELGLDKATFANSTGWPDPNHLITARELALLARHHIKDLAQFYPYWAETEYVWNGITQHNRNPLLYLNIGVDGLKTGHTVESGYGLVASGVRDGRRLILVVNGLASERERSEESQRVLDWGFREFKKYDLFAAGAVVDSAPVWQGAYEQVPLVLAEDLSVIITRDARRDMKVQVSYTSPVPAPITAGQQIGTLTVSAPDMPTREAPLLAGADVDRQGMIGRAWSALQQIIIGG